MLVFAKALRWGVSYILGVVRGVISVSKLQHMYSIPRLPMTGTCASTMRERLGCYGKYPTAIAFLPFGG
ncbi:hypothetical protein LCGC14_0849890 [marine sediment metagenome]|uniref:Uncharacterized protein n=1 Tax=marine sediment metagenome TaxID=412755 RepID=A0A0F9PFF2_9ZZZZ